MNIDVDVDSIFDVHIKRIHEYKRQLLNILHIMYLYDKIKNEKMTIYPRTFIFAGKAAPGYYIAKKIIKLINSLANMDLLEDNSDFDLSSKDMRIFSNHINSQPHYVAENAEISNSLICDGCLIKGSVNNSIISYDVVVEKGAIVKDSIIFNKVVVEEEAIVEKSIIGENIRIEKNTKTENLENEETTVVA